ncbi:MAG TPA: flagellar biosynthesis anti-sigma factor FlgM [Planctomycetaceae bacterium]|nr:flagellar biosynthesis anti-sigma factor FlgM [Planctomycetaceae bacterium]
MQIQGLQSAQAAQPAQRASQAPAAQPTAAPSAPRPTDSLQLSAEAQQLSQAQAANEVGQDGIRVEKVAALRQAIADGSYETPEKLDAALDRLLDTFA